MTEDSRCVACRSPVACSPARPPHPQRHRRRPLVKWCEPRTLLSALYTVNALTDTGAGSGNSGDLRYCVTQAGGTINFSVGGTIQLGSALPDLSQDVTLQGPGATKLTIQGGGPSSNFSIFRVDNGVTTSIADLTLAGGNALVGGGIDNHGRLTLVRSTLSGNSATYAGGLLNTNSATITGSTISDNTATIGGGLFNSNDNTTPTLVNSTLSGNSANLGGGLYNYSNAVVSVINSTIAGNAATTSGGGIWNDATLTLSNVTLANNLATNGGGLFIASGSPTTLLNSILAGNLGDASPAAAPSDITGFVDPITSFNNLVGTGAAGGLITGTNGNLVAVANPGLGALGNYGGPTQTIPLLPGSPAIDAGGNAQTTATTDQRGLARVVNGTVDIGAFESRGFSVTLVDASTPQSANLNVAFANPLGVVVASAYGEPVAGGIVRFVVSPVSGAGATLSAPAAAIGPNGQASVTATANNVAGSYSVVASANGGPTVATFTLTNRAITAGITNVAIGWGSHGTANLVTAADGLRLLPTGRTTDLPWLGIQRLTLTLNAPATLTAADVSVSGRTGVNYGPVTIAGSGTTYTITLAQPIDSVDRVTIIIGNAAIARFVRRLDVLPGDVNDDGVVNSQDLTLERNAVLANLIDIISEINGNGSVTLDDYNLVRRRINTKLPPLV